jgi:HAD superfamily hydrolase (TIGR01509 family)
VKTLPGGVCFDFNGVIVNDERHHCAALIAALAEIGVPLSEHTFYREYLGLDDLTCLKRGLGAAGVELDGTALAKLHARKRERYLDLLAADMTLVPGVTDFIVALLHRESPLAIVSAAPRDEIEFVLRRAGLDECFAAVIASDDATVQKPDPEAYHRALVLLGLPAQRCVAIEDSLTGLASGRAAGLRVVMLTTSCSRAELERADAAAVWDDFVQRRPEDLPWTKILH